MPVYDFQCRQCQKNFSDLVKGQEKINCPACNSADVKKLFSPFYTISDATKYECGAKDLPSMEKWQQCKRCAKC